MNAQTLIYELSAQTKLRSLLFSAVYYFVGFKNPFYDLFQTCRNVLDAFKLIVSVNLMVKLASQSNTIESKMFNVFKKLTNRTECNVKWTDSFDNTNFSRQIK